MPIRPIDYTSLVSKTQEVSRVKQIEHDKPEIQMQHEIVQQQKQIKHNIKKVRDTNKTENLIIDPNKERKDKKKYYAKEEQDDVKKKKDEGINDGNSIGETIDIRI